MTRFTSLSRMPLAVIYANRDSSFVAFGPISGKEGDEGGESEWGDERGGDIFLGAWAFKSGRVSGWGGGGRGHEKEGGNGGLGRERQTNEATTNPAIPSLLLHSSSGPWGKISHE